MWNSLIIQRHTSVVFTSKATGQKGVEMRMNTRWLPHTRSILFTTHPNSSWQSPDKTIITFLWMTLLGEMKRLRQRKRNATQVWCLNPNPAEISKPWRCHFSSSTFLTVKNVCIPKHRLGDRARIRETEWEWVRALDKEHQGVCIIL